MAWVMGGDREERSVWSEYRMLFRIERGAGVGGGGQPRVSCTVRTSGNASASPGSCDSELEQGGFYTTRARNRS